MPAFSDIVTFTSKFFQIEPGEDEETNPGIYGRHLATWLLDQLRARKIAAQDVFAEDFGWCVTVKTQPLNLYLACSSFDGDSVRWRVFAFAERGPLQWLRRSGDPEMEVKQLQKHLEAMIQSVPDATDVEWEAN